MNTPDPSHQLAEMRAVAFHLGMAFGGEAERASDIDRKLKLFEAFHQCFASVRLAIALDLRLKKPATQAAERETERAEGPDWNERPERPDTLRYTERDRDRETERASLPLLLGKLQGVLTDAEELLADAPEVPQLRALLARAKPEPAAAVRPPPSRDLRSRLAGSATTQVLRPSLRAPPPRRSTGPP
jgi:hypothetical protein